MKLLTVCSIFLSLFSVATAFANTKYTVNEVRTFNQTGNCLCANYVALHALEVRYKQREGQEIYLNRKNVQWSQIFDRYEEQIKGYRSNAVLDNCFTESPYPHDVFRQIAEYGIEAVPAEKIEKIDAFTHEMAQSLMDTILKKEEPLRINELTTQLDRTLGNFTGSVKFATQVLKADHWVGHVPGNDAKPTAITFVPPKEFSNELPMPAKMPKVMSLKKEKIFKKIIASLKNGIPVPFCAGYHCKSIDGIELDNKGEITSFYYADTYGVADYRWSSEINDESAHNGFLFVIME